MKSENQFGKGWNLNWLMSCIAQNQCWLSLKFDERFIGRRQVWANYAKICGGKIRKKCGSQNCSPPPQPIPPPVCLRRLIKKLADGLLQPHKLVCLHSLSKIFIWTNFVWLGNSKQGGKHVRMLAQIYGFEQRSDRATAQQCTETRRCGATGPWCGRPTPCGGSATLLRGEAGAFVKRVLQLWIQ